MRTRTLGSALAAVALLTTAALTTVTAAPASATTGYCHTTVHRDLKTVTKDGGATAEVSDKGLHLTTPSQPSRVRWQTSVAHNHKSITDLHKLTYRTLSIKDGDRGFAAPALRVNLSLRGVTTTLVYEPYYNGTVAKGGDWQTWDANAGGAAKWWSEQEPGNKQTLQPWSHWKTELAAAKVTSIGVGMGDYNEGADAYTDQVTIGLGRSCSTHQWKAKTPPSPDKDCKAATVHHDTKNVSIRNAANTADTHAAVTLTEQGVRVMLPDTDAKAYAYFPADGKKGEHPVPLREVTAARYATIKHDTGDASKAVLPSYQLGVDANGKAEGGFTTLVYEPYLNGGVKTVQTAWDAYAGKWWSTRSINGQPTRDVTRTLPEIVRDNPAAVVLYYGANVGAGNAGADVTFNDVVFAAGEGKSKVCDGHHWQAQKPGGGSNGGGSNGGGSAGGGSNGGGTGGSAGGGLPVTGVNVAAVAGSGAGLLALGLGALLLMRRRRTRFTA